MKVEIKKDGTLIISAQNELEAYALKKFSEDNFATEETIKNLSKSIVIAHGVADIDDDLPF